MSPGWRISPGLLATIAAAALSFGVCFAVVADATRTSSPGRAPAPRAERAAKTTLALQPAASLRVRDDLLPPPAPPPRRPVKAASTTPEPTTTTEPSQQETEAPQTTTTTPAEPVTTPQPQASKPKPKKKSEPKPSGPDFDDSGPQTPPSGG